LLREDNADQRLAPLGRSIGLLDDDKWLIFQKKSDDIALLRRSLEEGSINPMRLRGDSRLNGLGISELLDKISVFKLLKRPEQSLEAIGASGLWDFAMVKAAFKSDPWVHSEVADAVEIECRYEGYIKRERELVARVKEHEEKAIPQGFDFAAIGGISTEVAERLFAVRPETLGQAGRIPGVTPAAMALLYVHLEKGRQRGAAASRV